MNIQKTEKYINTYSVNPYISMTYIRKINLQKLDKRKN